MIFKAYTEGHSDSHLGSRSPSPHCYFQLLKSRVLGSLRVRAVLEVGEPLKCRVTVNQADDEI